MPAVMMMPPAIRKPFHLPRAEMICPATVVEIIRPRIIGRLIRPAAVGVLPSEIWKYWERNTVPPNMATPTSRLATVVSATVRLRKMSSGMIGSWTLDSTSTAASSRTTPAVTRAAVCHEAQSNRLPARVTHSSSALTPLMMRTAPR